MCQDWTKVFLCHKLTVLFYYSEKKKNPEIPHWLKNPWNLTRLPPLPGHTLFPFQPAGALHWVKDFTLVSTLTGMSPALPEAQLPASPCWPPWLPSLISSPPPSQLSSQQGQGRPLLWHLADPDFLSVTADYLSHDRARLCFCTSQSSKHIRVCTQGISWEPFS